MLHIRQICINDNGRVTCYPVGDYFEINRVKEEKDAERVSRFMKSAIEADADIEAEINIRVKHRDAGKAEELVKDSAKNEPEDPLLSPLTPREKEVFYLLAQGKSNLEIAGLLNVSLAAVKIHALHIYDKLHIHSRLKILIMLRERKP